MSIKSMQVFNLMTTKVDESKMNPSAKPGTIIDFFSLVYLIRADEGNIMVDAGFHPDDLSENMITGTRVNLPDRLNNEGLTFDDIKTVIMTHLDNDHVGYLNYFTRSNIVVQKEEYNYAFNPPESITRRIDTKRFNSTKLHWILIDGDHVLWPGLALILTSGHTPGSQTVMVNLPLSGPVLLVGDAVHKKEDLDYEKYKPKPSLDPKQWAYSINRLKALSQMTGAPMFPYHALPIYPAKKVNVFHSRMFKTGLYK
jgi:N-acyl homoserine lactone hydrolase